MLFSIISGKIELTVKLCCNIPMVGMPSLSNVKNFALNFTGIESEPEHVPPKPQEKPPQIKKPITNTLVVEGSPAKFVAEYSGEPQPQVTWLRNALQTLQETRNIKVGVLRIFL